MLFRKSTKLCQFSPCISSCRRLSIDVIIDLLDKGAVPLLVAGTATAFYGLGRWRQKREFLPITKLYSTHPGLGKGGRGEYPYL